MNRYVYRIGLSMIGLLACATFASALTVDASGKIVNWGFTPFGSEMGNWANGAPPLGSGINGQDSGENQTTAWTEGNNSSPIDFPGGPPDYVPAPGGPLGERFDLEMLAWRTVSGNRIQVLGISSINPNTGASWYGGHEHVGDVFVDVNDDGSYDRALTAGKWNTPLHDPIQGDNGYSHQMDIGIYSIDSVHGISDSTHNLGGDPVIAAVTNPFSLDSGTDQDGNMTFEAVSHDYGTVNGSNENGTWILEWTFDIAALGPLPIDPNTGLPTLKDLTFHWTVECGNDHIDRGPRSEPNIPEPGTLALMGLGLVSMGLIRRRKSGR